MPFRAIIHSMILQTAGSLTLSALLMFLPAGRSRGRKGGCSWRYSSG